MPRIASLKSQYPPRNPAKAAFENLTSAWNMANDDEMFEIVLTAVENFRSAVVAQGDRVCIGLWPRDRVRLHNLALFLDQYGVILRQKPRGDGYVFIFAEIAQVAPSPYADARVLERKVERVAA